MANPERDHQCRIAKSPHPQSPFVCQPSKDGLWINEPGVTIRPFKSAL